MVLANEMRGSSSIYSQCNSRETRLQGSSANMSYYSVAGASHCCNNCRFNRLFHPSHLQILSPSEQLSAAIYFFYPNRIFFFYPNKVLRLTYPLWQHWMTWVFTVGSLHVYLVQLITTSKIKSKGNKIQDQIQSPFNANLHLSPQILIRKTKKQQLPQLLTTR